DALKHYDVRIIVNNHFNEGMYSSVQEGVKTLEAEVETFFILPADNPLVRASTVNKILARYHSAGKPGIIYPAINGLRGHPKLISAKYINTIVNTSYPDGLKGLLKNFEHDAVAVEVTDVAVRLDMNTQEEHRFLVNHLNNRAAITFDLCCQILQTIRVNQYSQAHCYLVAGLALALTNHLNKAGAFLDVDTVLAGALLHDVVRCHKHRALANSLLLADMSYPQVAEIAAVNSGKNISKSKPLSESDVIFLADKMVMNQQIISINEYFTTMLEKHVRDRKTRRAILRKRKQAELIKKKVEKKIGLPIDTIKLKDSIKPNTELPDNTKEASRPTEHKYTRLQNLSNKANSGSNTGSKLWLEKNGIVFDEVLYTILTYIDFSGSIAQAARELGMSYRSALGKIKTVEDSWRILLLHTEVGGGARLTPLAQELLHKFRSVKHEIDHLTLELNMKSTTSLKLSL
ncbi:MAG TPA: hypothetical protein DCZ10_07835, partial [Pelotomaculum sp.]|nr:hypothetical protein [Pelotomaculum sp.]